jgi:hypothetical protein
MWINHQFKIITETNVVWDISEFSDAHYVKFRNDAKPDFIFFELFYGPTIVALCIGVFFLVCRTFNFTKKNSTVLCFILGFTTIMWAYSQTSLNSAPVTLFVLLGFYFLRKSNLSHKTRNVILCSTCVGFGFLIRPDAIIFIAAFLGYLIYNLIKDSRKIRDFILNSIKIIPLYIVPVGLSYYIEKTIWKIRFGENVPQTLADSSENASSFISGYLSAHSFPLYEGAFGLLFSPGLGLLIFSPILFLVFVSFTDFFKKNKNECILLIIIISSFLLFYGTIDTWHGLNSWGPRYIVSIVPFMLLPLGSSLEKRTSLTFRSFVIILSSLGIFINLVYLIQDVSWFVWGWPGTSGLYGLDIVVDGWRHPLNVDPAVIWTFEYSQLTHSIINVFYNYQPDIFLLKILTPPIYFGFIIPAAIFSFYYFRRILK